MTTSQTKKARYYNEIQNFCTFLEKSFAANILGRFFDFWSENFLKKHRFLIIALALSILLHVLIFIFAPELKSEINSNSYLKKITRISIFREEPERRDIVTTKRRDIVTTKRRNDVTTKRRDDVTTGQRDDVTTKRRDDVTTKRRNDVTTKRRDDVTTGQRDDVTTKRRDDVTTGQRDDVTTGQRDDVTTGQRDDGTTETSDGAPKTAGELAVIPKALNPKTPDYPETLEDEGIEGTVTLELLISKDGKVMKAKVIKSDHELFSESALRAVKKYKFSPGKLADGTSADSIIEFVVKFEISL